MRVLRSIENSAHPSVGSDKQQSLLAFIISTLFNPIR